MMNKTLRNALVIILSVLACCMFVACNTNKCQHVYENELTCVDRVCTVEGCDHVETASTEHVYGEWLVIVEPTCEATGLQRKACDCGATQEEILPAAGHIYADEHTCHDRECTVEDCEYVQSATTGHAWGEWEEETPSSCQQDGEKKRACADCGEVEREKVSAGHNLEEGVCTGCQKTYQELFITIPNPENELSYDELTGTYSLISNEEPEFGAYAYIEGSMLTYLLEEVGLSKLTITITNPAPYPCDAEDKCKSFMMATSNEKWDGSKLWSSNTAIAYWSWQPFWDNGRTATFELNLRMYAGYNIIMYTSQSGKYPLLLTIDEFVDYSNPRLLLSDNENGAVTYHEGIGWEIASKGGTSGIYWKMSTAVIQNALEEGNKFLKITFANHFGTTNNVGSFVNTQTAILPEKNTGGNDWLYANGFVSQIASVLADGSYYYIVNITDPAYDWTKDLEFYVKQTDVNEKEISSAYILGIEFMDEADLMANLFTPQEGNDAIEYTAEEAKYSVTSTDNSSYVVMSAQVTKSLKALGYNKITLTVKNTATGAATDDNLKSVYIAADQNSNLWSEETAIAFYGWKAFFDAGRVFTVEIDLNTYAGRNIIIYGDKANLFAHEITVQLAK